jgi:protein gp37
MKVLAAIGWRTWISYEPALSTVEWKPWMSFVEAAVVGGESGGKNARPMDPDWPRSLRDECETAGVRFHFKQWGRHRPTDISSTGKSGPHVDGALLDGQRHDRFPGGVR